MAIAEGICSPNVKMATKFPQVLTLSIETLLTLCNDDESDIRMVADETLNKIIRVQHLCFTFLNNTYCKNINIYLISIIFVRP